MRWLAVLVLVGCASDTSVQYTEYLEAWRTATCNRLVRCHEMPDVATCLAHKKPITPSGDLMAAVDQGKLLWHGDVAQSCLATLETLTCDLTSPEYRNPLCVGITTGALHDGDECTFGSECISHECSMQGPLACDDNGCCRGTCVGNDPVHPQIAGGVCRYNDCIDSYCKDSICRALLPEGATCDIGDDNAFGTECDYGLTCKEGKCMKAAATGELCAGICANAGEFCDTSAVCRPKRVFGETCASSGECQSIYECDATQKCALPMKVEPIPFPVGAACRYGADVCAAPAFCDADLPAGNINGICTLPKALGGSCYWDGQCASDSCNDFGVCIAARCI